MSKRKQVGTVIFQVLLFVITAVTLICAILKFGIYDRDILFSGIVDSAFDKTVLEAAEHSFDSGQSIIAFPANELYEALDKSAFLNDCHQYTASAVDALMTGSEITLYQGAHKEIEKTVRKQFEAFEQESGMIVSEEDIAEVTTLLTNHVNAQANYLPETVQRLLPKMGTSVNRYASLLLSFLFPGALLTLCFVVLIFLINQDNFSRAAYKSAVAMWMASATVFIPSMIFCSYDVGERLKLKASGMASFAQGIVNTIETQLKTCTITAFAIMTVVLVVCMAWYSVMQTKRHEKYTWRKE